MIVPQYYEPKKAELKVIAPLAEAAMHAIPGQEDLSLPYATKPNRKAEPEIFSISFSYQGQRYQTKVLVSGNGKESALYKVALNSRLAGESTPVCWLQRSPQGWVNLLGKPMDAALLTAITAAIEHRR